MAADQTLIAAAGKMGPAKVDYSGYMKAIGAVGKYINTKNAVAQGYINDRPDGIDFEEIPAEMLETQGNREFFEENKTLYNESVKTIRNQPAFTKKYREAVKTINDIKKGFENVKNDLTQYAEYKLKNNQGFNNMSKQTIATDRGFHSDVAINPATKYLDSKVLFTLEGVTYDGVSLNDFPSLITKNAGIKAAVPFNKIMEKAILDMENNRDFDADRTRNDIEQEIEAILTDPSGNGLNVIKSIAFDVKFVDVDGESRSFMNSISSGIKNDNGLSIDDEIKIFKKTLKDDGTFPTESEVATTKELMLADIWGSDQNESFVRKLTNHLFKLADNAHHKANNYSLLKGKNNKTNKIFAGFNGEADNWNVEEPVYIGWKEPEEVENMVNNFNSEEPFLDWFGNTYVPTYESKGTDNVGKRKIKSYKVIPKIGDGKPLKNKDGGGDMILTYNEAYQGLLGEYKPKQLP
jgi:hypothetical protein|tara:strand:+ start:920 stop:2311 length:1392 start_codon:yes stop_codon:yes gene_type:complete